MLDHLRVVNLGVLEDASIDPSPGFTVVTGETGAGKTLLLGGLRLILGGSADSSAVGPYGAETRVDGLFAAEGAEMGATRVVPATGRSRSYLEGSIVSADALKDRLGELVEIVGQHDQLTITRRAHILALIDGCLDVEGQADLTEYRSAWARLQEARERQSRLGGDEMELTRELDLARYQASEIAAAALEPGLDESLETDVSRLRNVEEIREHLQESHRAAEQLSDLAGEIVARVRKANGLDTGLSDVVTDAEGVSAAAAEMTRQLRDRAESLEDDPRMLVELEERLTALGELKRKYGRTLEEVIAFGQRTAARVGELEGLIADADRIDALVAAAVAGVDDAGRVLHSARKRAAEELAERMRRHLSDLGLGSAIVEARVDSGDPGPGGSDRVELRFATDDRFQPEPVGSVASGGELSRLVLALRLAASRGDAATLVFDEVDTGIGGATALAMGRKLAELARQSQVLCVTHLPQVAAHADAHFVVERSDGVATVRRVEGEDRVSEITRMLAGQPESDAGKTAAAELLASASV